MCVDARARARTSPALSLSSLARYRAVLTRNFEVLNKGRGGKQFSLMNVVGGSIDRARRG